MNTSVCCPRWERQQWRRATPREQAEGPRDYLANPATRPSAHLPMAHRHENYRPACGSSGRPRGRTWASGPTPSPGSRGSSIAFGCLASRASVPHVRSSGVGLSARRTENASSIWGNKYKFPPTALSKPQLDFNSSGEESPDVRALCFLRLLSLPFLWPLPILCSFCSFLAIRLCLGCS